MTESPLGCRTEPLEELQRVRESIKGLLLVSKQEFFQFLDGDCKIDHTGA